MKTCWFFFRMGQSIKTRPGHMIEGISELSSTYLGVEIRGIKHLLKKRNGEKLEREEKGEF